MLQLYPVYSLWNRRKTLIGSPDHTRANGTNKFCPKIQCHQKIIPNIKHYRFGTFELLVGILVSSHWVLQLCPFGSLQKQAIHFTRFMNQNSVKIVSESPKHKSYLCKIKTLTSKSVKVSF